MGDGDGHGTGEPNGWEKLTNSVTEALLALEGATIEDFQLPLPGDLRDLSKAAAMVSGVVEDRIPAMLNQVRAQTWDKDGNLVSFEFRRSTIGFPDILLVQRSNPDVVIFEIEAKSWYILSADPLTARFFTSSAAINDGTLVAVVAWMLDGVVSGSPVLLRIHVAQAKALAEARDAEWVKSNPDTHRVVEPDNTGVTAKNLMKNQVRGEYLSGGTWAKDSDNFGKLDRIHYPDLQAFREGVWDTRAAGVSLRDWRSFIKSKKKSQPETD